MGRGTDEREAVVVPAASAPSTVACIRSLAALGVHTIVVSEDPAPAAFCSKYCDEAVLVPDPESDLEGYARALLALARREDVKTIVPVREEDAFVLSKHRAAFAEHVATPWPSLETMRQVHDRVLLAAAAEEAGVPAPRTQPLGEVDDWDQPAIVKSRYNIIVDEYVDSLPAGRTGRNKTIRYLNPGEKPDVKSLCAEFGHEPIVQEYVPITEEYMFAALYDHGEALATFQHEQIRGTSYANGGGVYRKSVFVPELERVARELLDHLDWHGLACIEYMRDPETGEYKFAEINPRMWMSLSANVRMGAEFPRNYWFAATDRPERIDPGYDLGAECHYLQGELMYVASLFRDESPYVDRPSLVEALRDIVGSCCRDPTFDVLTRDDPAPFVQDFLSVIEDRVAAGPDLSELARRICRGKTPIDWKECVEGEEFDVEATGRRSSHPNEDAIPLEKRPNR